MAYILANITPEDQQKILADAECDLSKKRAFSYVIKRGELKESWAIDRDNDSYFMRSGVCNPAPNV
jgi:hypothetical protein